MSRNIYKRSNRTGTTSSDLVRDPLNTIAELRAYPVTDTLDKTLIYVKAASGVYAYHYDGTGTDDGNEIILPSSGNGRWLKVIGSDSYTDEEAQDAIFDFLVAGNNITLTHDDAANSLTIDATDTNTNQLTEWTVSDGSSTSTVAHGNTVQFSGTGGISVTESSKTVTIDGSSIAGDTYTISAAQDGANADLTLDATAGSDSTVQLTAGSNITLTATANEITIDAAGGGISGITVQEEGSALSTAATTLNFTGTLVTASGTGATKTINVTGDNLGNHTATQDLNMGTHDIAGNKLRFVDSSAFSSHPDYFFYGKYDVSQNPANKPAKITLYADDGDTNAARGKYISIQPPDAGLLVSSYGLKFPTTAGTADQVLTLPTGWTGTGTAALEWKDRCCIPGEATESTPGTITIATQSDPVGSGGDDHAITVAAIPSIQLTDFDLGSFTLAYSSVTGTPSLGAVATSNDYDDLTNKPTIPTNNNELTNGAGYVTSNTQLTTEQVQDIVGGMLSGNTETGITTTYQDGDGTIDFAVSGATFGTHAETIDLAGANFATSTSTYYNEATYMVYRSSETAYGYFRIEQPQNYATGSVITIINKGNATLTVSTTKAGNATSYIQTLSATGLGSATSSITLTQNQVAVLRHTGSAFVKA